MPRLAVVVTHPIQYQAPWFRGLAQALDLHVFFAQRGSAEQQSSAGYGVSFDWDVDLLSGYSSTVLTNVARKPSLHGFSGSDTPELSSELREGRFDAVLICGWATKTYLQALYACRRWSIPAIVRGDSQLATPRGFLKKVLKNAVYPKLLANYAACLYVGRRNRDYLEHYGVEPARLFHAPHAVNNGWFAEQSAALSPNRPAIRASLGISENDVLALFVGRLIDVKRPLDLVAAAAKVASDRRLKPVFVGAGELEPEVRAYSQRLGVDSKLLGFKNQSELPALYVAADLLVLPSESETWGLVVNEAMACGTPAVVIEEAGCAPDMIEPGRTGSSFRSGDVSALTHAIEMMLPRLGSAEVADALRAKCAQFSVESAVAGTLEALEYAVHDGKSQFASSRR